VEQGGLKPEAADGMLGLLSAAAAWREIADAQLVIEAVFEDAAVKRAVIGEIEAVCPYGPVLGGGSLVLLVAFGSGFVWASALVRM
jgi:3-hydroxyacyl-CoA dehydrogenase